MFLLLTGCNPGEKNSSSGENIALGESVFNKNCIGCHGSEGVGIKNWKVKDENGNYPAPPLKWNGSYLASLTRSTSLYN